MSGNGILKKLKMEPETVEERGVNGGKMNSSSYGAGRSTNSCHHYKQEEDDDLQDQEDALIALIEHRTSVVEQLRRRLSYYHSQLEDMEKKLHVSQSKLARLRCRSNDKSSQKIATGSSMKEPKDERRSSSPIQTLQGSSQSQQQSKPKLVIPDVSPILLQPTKLPVGTIKATASSSGQADTSFSQQSDSVGGRKVEKSHGISSDYEHNKSDMIGSKRKIECKEHEELIPLVRSSSSTCLVRCNSSTHISSQHKRKMRSIILCPVNDKLFITSALDGVVNLWQLQGKGSGATRLSTTDCLSPKQRKWPEDMAWHPTGSHVFAVYSADAGDNQISILDLNRSQGSARVTFLKERPHVKGLINSIMFMPWDDVCYMTGGSDHAVILWNESEDNIWKPKTLHRILHSSAVMGVAGMQHKKTVLSAGADKRIIGYDILAGRPDYKNQIESKCMSVLPNPCDFNLFMVQTGTPGRQLRLYDIRLRQTEIHAFGWKQESSESQSALIGQAWSPDGLYITSGSADPMIHIFDIRYNDHKPSQSVQAHQKRVFKAIWHKSIPVLTSISSDLNIGIHKIS